VAKTYNGARMTTATTGTGTITLGAAVSGYLTFAAAGVANADVVAYGIADGANFECGTGTYTTTGTTLTRTVRTSSNANAAISLSGSAQVYLTACKEDLLMVSESQAVNTVLAAPSGAAGAPSFRLLAQTDMPMPPFTLDAGTVSAAPLLFTSGTNLTTPAAGAEEFDGTCFYATAAASTRQVVDTEQVIVQAAAYTLTNTTALQKVFNASANGAVTLAIGTYFFESIYNITGMSSSQPGVNIAFCGTAVIGSIAYKADSTDNVGANGSGGYFTVATSSVIVSSYIVTNINIRTRGVVRVTTGGTFIPQIGFSTATSGTTIAINSWFRIWPLGGSAVATVGNWS